MNQLKLEEREEQFCLFYRETGNGKEAALAAGYPARTAGKKALALLSDKRIQRRLGQLRRAGKSYREDEIAAGLRRLAFGPVNDAVRLAVLGRELSSDELERLDLYCLSELKVGEKGIEMKFFDRQKAFALLRELEAGRAAGERSSFYEALEQGAAAFRAEDGKDG